MGFIDFSKLVTPRKEVYKTKTQSVVRIVLQMWTVKLQGS